MTLAGLIHAAHKVVFMTGAGVSTASGIPDYRSKTGIYREQERPEYLLSHTNLLNDPASLYQFVTTSMYFPKAKPNIIHTVMARIANQKGSIITQNVDGLHTLAGARSVIEFHGNLYHVHCLRCGQAVPYQAYLKNMLHEQCGGVLRPDIVLYEENIAPSVLEAAITAIRTADLIIVVGTSFRVYPFAGLLTQRQSNATVIAINREPIDFAEHVTQIQADAVQVFEQLSKE